MWLHSYSIRSQSAFCTTDLGLNTVWPVHFLPIEGMGLSDSPVQTTGCPVTDQLEQKHHSVICVLGNCQVDSFSWLGGNLDDGIAYSKKRKRKRYMLNM